MKVAKETWETAELKDKIDIVFRIVYGVNRTNGRSTSQDEYILLDYFIDHPVEDTLVVFQKDWENIQSYIIT